MKKILIIDDDEGLRLVITQALSSHLACEVVTANDAVSGIATLQGQSFDLVITDLSMPAKKLAGRNYHLEGLEVIKAVKQLPQPTKVALFSGTVSHEVRDHAMNLSVDCILHKPLDFEDLIHAVKAMLA
ncbi:MAG: response regulator [Candidatus Taylorbacteria bacterium]